MYMFKPANITGGDGMRKRFVFLCIVFLITASASPLFAGGIDNKTNWSAEWVRMLNRNAATDSADAVSYNPAGVMKMDNGLYLNATGQYAMKDYSNTFNGTKYETDEPDFVPSLFALYKQDRWAAFGAVTIVVAGGKIDYENGDVTTLSQALMRCFRARRLLLPVFWISVSKANLTLSDIPSVAHTKSMI